MPDGYGNDMPSWAINYTSPAADTSAKWLMAKHLRLDHGMAYHRIAKMCGLRYNEVRERLRDDDA